MDPNAVRGDLHVWRGLGSEGSVGGMDCGCRLHLKPKNRRRQTYFGFAQKGRASVVMARVGPVVHQVKCPHDAHYYMRLYLL